MRTYNKYMDGSRILLGCHRGDRKNFPENTMSAFKAAVDLGLDAIETDIRMTNTDQLIMVYCRSGRRSKEAAEKLVKLGYTNIVEFGGILDWKGEIVTE